MTDFVALYRGRTVSDATLVAVSAEPRLVRRFFAELLGENETKEHTGAVPRSMALKVARNERDNQ